MNEVLILLKNKRFAFTLAEVLLTLAIVGVVAAITIPVLINNTQMHQYVVKMKKEYSVMSQAFEQIASDNSGSFIGAISSCSDNDCFMAAFKPKYTSVKLCPGGASAGACFPLDSNIRYLNGSAIGSDNWGVSWNDPAGMILNDGTSLGFTIADNTCASWGTTISGYSDVCGWISVDVNGLTPPNMWGKDIYVFFVRSNSISPSRTDSDWGNGIFDDCGPAPNQGQSCAAKYLKGDY